MNTTVVPHLRPARRAVTFGVLLGLVGIAASTSLAPAAHAAPVPNGTINTVIGQIGDGGPAKNAYIVPSLLTTDPAGNVLESDNYRVRKIDVATGVIDTIAGNGASHTAQGDGGPALQASFGPAEVVVAANGDMYVGDSDNYRVRKIDAATGIISTFAGTGVQADNGDNGPANLASLKSATGLALDGLGHLFIADFSAHKIRVVDLASNIITTYAGTGSTPFNGDNQPATSANLGFPYSLTVDASNNLYIDDRMSNRIREVDTLGNITTVAGTGLTAFNGDGVATAANLNSPGQVKWFNGSLYLSEPAGNRVRRVDLAANTITTIAGTGVVGLTGDGGPADQATLSGPFGIAVGPTGSVYISDLNGFIRVVTNGTIDAFAGIGGPYGGDNGPGTAATISGLEHIAVDGLGNIYIADAGNSRVRKWNAASGIITTIAGTGQYTYNGDGPALSTNLYPTAIAVTATGDLYIAEGFGGRIRKLTVATGMISTVAGTGDSTFNGDGDALATNIYPADIALDANGDLVLGDYVRLRRLTFADGKIMTLAGTGTSAFNGDGPVATTNIDPRTLAIAPDGTIYFGDGYYGRVRKLTLADGMVTTVAGTGTTAFNGDGPALAANVYPSGLAVDAHGDVYIGDSSNGRVRKLTVATQMLSTVAGSDLAGFSGDGGPATASQLNYPESVALDAFGHLYIGDSANNRVRSVELDATAPVPPVYQPVAPERLLDTRVGVGAPVGKVAAVTTLELQVTGVGTADLPADAAAVVLNVTVTEPNADGFLTVWPCGSPMPLASNLNYYKADDTIANLVIAKVGTGGKVCLNSQASTHLVADLSGWFPAGAAYNAVQPERLLDTRAGVGAPSGKLVAGSTLTLQVTGAGTTNVPADATAVVVNVTVTQPDLSGYLTVWPCGSPMPLASNLNYEAGQTIPNLVITKLGSGGTICISGQRTTHVIADINGWFPAGPVYNPMAPQRLIDTRGNGATPAAQVPANGVTAVQITGAGSPAVPTDAAAVAVNVTVTDPSADGFLTVWPCGSPRPLASNVNYKAGQTIPNLVVVKIGAGGKICLSGQVALHVIVDIAGWF